MRNPYDSAHQLAKDLSHSSEYQEFKNAGEKAKESKTLLKQLQDFMQKQMILEIEMMRGQNPSEEKLKEFPNRDKYLKKEHDMKLLTLIDKKVNNNT